VCIRNNIFDIFLLSILNTRKNVMKIKAAENGPYLLEITEGKIVRNGKEEILSQKMIALCRCGESSNIPFCDGAHKKCEFKGEVVEMEVK